MLGCREMDKHADERNGIRQRSSKEATVLQEALDHRETKIHFREERNGLK